MEARRAELIASIRLAQRLSSLDTLRWSSWFSKKVEADGDGNPGAMWTTVRVKRAEGRIKATRTK
jgi:hypothetical protein